MTWMPVVGCLLSFLSIVLLIGAVVAFVKQRQKFNERMSTTGTVISLERRVSTTSTHGSAGMFYPVVEFRTSSGETVQFESGFGSMPASHRIDQSVKIAYNPSNPSQAEIDSVMSRYLASVVLGFLGLVMLCIGMVFLLMGLLITLPLK